MMDSDNSIHNTVNSDDGCGEGSDWIELYGLGHVTRWKFSQSLAKCPVSTCSADADSLGEIIQHYKEAHSQSAILCYICDWPIVATNFQNHFRIIHPNEVNPFNFDNDSNQSVQNEETSPQTDEVCK